MRANLTQSVDLILKHEGGYVDHPRDPGGCTNHGITIATYRKLVDPNGTCASLRAMSRGVAEAIYRDTYWSAVNGDGLPGGVDLMVFDFGVNAGPSRAARALQAAVGAGRDGVIGPLTLERVRAMDPAQLVRGYAARRLDYYRSLKTWSTFGKGWTSRVAETLELALKLASHAAEPKEEDVPEPKVQMSDILADIEVVLRTAEAVKVKLAAFARQTAEA